MDAEHQCFCRARFKCPLADEASEGHFICVSIKGRIFKETATKTEKKDRPTVILCFLQTLNALLNEGSGVLCLHDKDYDFVGGFTEQVDDKIKYMLNDGSLFSEKIQAGQVPGKVENYTECARRRYEVVRTSRIARTEDKVTHQLPFVLNYNTKESLDKGLVDLDHIQFQAFFGNVSSYLFSEPARHIIQANTFKFIEKKEVIGQSPFVETRNLQAKSVPRQDSNEELIRYIWNKVYLYISAFSKNAKGGSVLFGLAEQKISIDATEWQCLHCPDVRIVQPGWLIFKHVRREEYLLCMCDKYHLLRSAPRESSCWSEIIHEQEYRGIFQLANSSRRWKVYKEITKNAYCVVPNEKKTGKTVCEGIHIDDSFETELSKAICKKTRDELLWVGHTLPVDPVDVTFYPVYDENEIKTDKKVIKVAVKYYHGIVFTSKEGPEIYALEAEALKTQGGLDKIVKRVGCETWLSAQFDSENAGQVPVEGAGLCDGHFTKKLPSFTKINLDDN